MYLLELGSHIRRARKGRGLTQSALAKQAGIARETLSQLESGTAKDLGLAKIARILRVLNIGLVVVDSAHARRTDHVALAAAAGSTGFRNALGGEELIRALLKGEPPAQKAPHLRRLLEDSPPELIAALVAQVSEWTEGDRVRSNLMHLARNLDVTPRPEWMKSA